MSKKEKSAKPKNQAKLDKSIKKEFKKDKFKLKKLDKEIKKRTKAIVKLNKELKKEEKDLNKLKEKKEALLVAHKLQDTKEEENFEKEVHKPKTAKEIPTNNATKRAPMAKRATVTKRATVAKSTVNTAPEPKEESKNT